MAAPPGNFLPLNLGPRFTGPTSHLPLNLGVDWWTDDPDPPDPPDPVIRGVRRAAGIPWRLSESRVRRLLSIAWGTAPALRREAMVPWSIPARLGRTVGLPWGTAPHVRMAASLQWQGTMARLQQAGTLAWATLPLARQAVAFSWRHQALLHGRAPRVAWQAPPLSGRGVGLAWRAQLPQLRRGTTASWLHPEGRRWDRWIPWGVARRVPWIVVPRPEPPPEPPPPGLVPDGRYIGLNLGCPVVDVRGFAPLNLGINACYAVRPRRRTYIVINDVSVVRLPDREPIAVLDLAIAGGADSWGWTVDLTLADAGSLALLQPGSGGPRQIEVALNGYLWTFIVEAYSGTRDHLNQGIRVSGRSRTALLSAPYAPARNKVSEFERSAAQLVDEELASTGYTADYDTVDWLVPPGAWYYDATTPLDAIARVAAASGGVVQSDPEALELHVRPRYPHSPWTWTETTPDHMLYDDVVVNESMQVRSAPLYNAVVVTGELAGAGVTATVTRSGEGADLYAPQVSDPLINTDAVAIEHGRNVLSDRGEQAAIEFTLPLFRAPVLPGQTGRILPLDLVEVQSDSGTWHGQCTGVRIDVRVDMDGGRPTTVIEQTVTLERHYTDAD